MSITRTQSPFTIPLLSFPSASQGDIHQDSEIDINIGCIAESPEHLNDERLVVNLGAESPASILQPAVEDPDETNVELKKGSADEWRKAGIAVHTDVPMRSRSWRSSSFSEKRRLHARASAKAAVIDRDCGICFEAAVTPCRMVCCGTVFCLNHISDWLYGSSSDGRCPSCRELCGLMQEGPSTHPADGKHVGYAQTCPPKPEQSVVLVLLPAGSKSSSLPMTRPSKPPNSGPGTVRADPPKPPTLVAIRTDAADVPHASDPYFQLGPCHFHLNSALVVGCMIGRVLSVVGLTLVLFVLLT